MHERDILEDHLRLAELRVVEAEEIVAKQLHVIGELEAGGRDTTDARELLATCEENLRLHENECERLRRELEKLK
jgi:hypothetical protein